MKTLPRVHGVHWVCLLALFAFASGCVYRSQPPPPPAPLEGVTAVAVIFDYSALRVNGMGSPKTEAEWLAAKTAEDPAYPTTWADLKSRFEESFLQSFAGGAAVPISRFVEGVAPPPTGAVLKVSMSEFQLGKYIPFATQQSSISTAQTWWRNEQMVQSSATSASFMPGITTPSVFQHVGPIGQQSGQQTARTLRDRPAQASGGGGGVRVIVHHGHHGHHGHPRPARRHRFW